MTVGRRGFLLGALSSVLFTSNRAQASIARALPLGELLYKSRHVVVGTAVDAYATWEQVGPRRCIVTYSLFRIEEPLDGREPPGPDLTIRTLGGTVGELGQTFFGEAVVALNRRAAVFVRDIAPNLFAVTAMAQGYYAIAPDDRGAHRLNADFASVSITELPEAAMRRLHGRTVPEAADLILHETDIGKR